MFFAKSLARVQLTRYKARLKSKAKIGDWTKSHKALGQAVFFAQLLGRVQFKQDTKPVKKSV
ncbi:hypothetical protein DDV21_010970 [Streptococcus chenjunshii]|uniref:Uncharacterized protein n=1 Tax=Streptococcus chenjunshii TaxID=2173853 RepID=A0A346NFI8_9STRE|nr:hypothetical protein DDV21_010970 [Streptococcus chenjunshii]RFU51529.1 hypothetical protein DDV22_03025 [Streptococcus chenjunshii]